MLLNICGCRQLLHCMLGWLRPRNCPVLVIRVRIWGRESLRLWFRPSLLLCILSSPLASSSEPSAGFGVGAPFLGVFTAALAFSCEAGALREWLGPGSCRWGGVAWGPWPRLPHLGFCALGARLAVPKCGVFLSPLHPSWFGSAPPRVQFRVLSGLSVPSFL